MKKIKLKHYDMTFMYYPAILLSVISVICYIIRLFNTTAADIVFFLSTVLCLSYFIINRVSRKFFKAVLLLTALFYTAAYFFIGNSAFSLAAERLSQSVTSFSFFDCVFNTAGIFDFESLVLFSSYGGARLINGSIVSGVSNIVRANENSQLVYYLSSRIILIFSLLGILLTERKNFKANLLLSAIMLISGNPAPALLLLLFTKPPVYFLALLINFIGSAVVSWFEIKGVFVVAPSVFEIIYHSNNLIMILAVSLLFCAASYIAVRIVTERKK